MLLKVGDLAKRCGLTVRTLHHYDSIGLLKPSPRFVGELAGCICNAPWVRLRGLVLIGQFCDDLQYLLRILNCH